jgi:predicted ribonuclease YlaK
MWVGKVRGMTFSNSIIIYDEWQNSGLGTSKLVFSRPDSNCKLIVLGCNTQIDNTRLTKYSNGLTKLIKESQLEKEDIKEKFYKEHGRELQNLVLFNIKLIKSERGKFAEFSERVF